VNTDHSNDVLEDGVYWPKAECCGRAQEYVVVATPQDGDWITCKWCGHFVRREFEMSA